MCISSHTENGSIYSGFVENARALRVLQSGRGVNGPHFFRVRVPHILTGFSSNEDRHLIPSGG